MTGRGMRVLCFPDFRGSPLEVFLHWEKTLCTAGFVCPSPGCTCWVTCLAPETDGTDCCVLATDASLQVQALQLMPCMQPTDDAVRVSVNRRYIGQFSRDGRFFAAAYQDQRVRLYDVEKGWKLRQVVLEAARQAVHMMRSAWVLHKSGQTTPVTGAGFAALLHQAFCWICLLADVSRCRYTDCGWCSMLLSMLCRKDVRALRVRWTITDTCMSPDQSECSGRLTRASMLNTCTQLMLFRGQAGGSIRG
jgi:hypothetical protein